MTDHGLEYLKRVTRNRRLTLDDESAIEFLLNRHKVEPAVTFEIIDPDEVVESWTEYNP